MTRLINSVKIDLFILSRRWFFWVSISMLIAGLEYIVWGRLGNGDAGGALTSTAAIVQIGMLYFSLIGFYLVRQEKTSNMSEIVNTISRGYIHKYISKFITVLLLIIGFVTVTLFITLLQYYLSGVPVDFFSKVILYMMLYYLLPFWISAWLGCILGSFRFWKLSLIVLVLINILTGPLNTLVFTNIMAVLNIDLYPMLSFLNLGQSDIHLLYDPIYGFPLEINRWLVKLQWLGIIVIIITVCLLTIKEIKKMNATVLIAGSAFIMMISQYFILQPSQVIHTLYEKDSRAVYDRKYYSNQLIEQNTQDVPNFKVEKYKVQLNVQRSMGVTVELELTSKENLSKVSFSLYHKFIVHSVTDQEGNKLSFTRDKDDLEVIFPDKVVKGTPFKLKIQYSGVSSPYFYANEQAILLPAYFNWLPAPGSYPSMVNTDGYRFVPVISSLIDQPIEYEMYYSGNKPIYTNLKQITTDKWGGTSRSGITIAAGMMRSQIIDNIQVFDSLSNYKANPSIQKFINELKQIRPIVIEDFGLQKPELSAIFLLPVPIEPSGILKSTWDMGDHFILSAQTNLNDDSLLEYEGINVAGLAGAMIRTSGVTMNSVNEDLLLIAYEYWYNIRHNMHEKTKLEKLIEFQETENNSDSDLLVNLQQWIEKNTADHKRMRNFFQAWLSLIEDGADKQKIQEFLLGRLKEGE